MANSLAKTSQVHHPDRNREFKQAYSQTLGVHHKNIPENILMFEENQIDDDNFHVSYLC